jgi:hypothetical protein
LQYNIYLYRTNNLLCGLQEAGDKDMAKPIKLGLILEGEDAVRFEEYLKNPTDTLKGKMLMKRATKLSKQLRW